MSQEEGKVEDEVVDFDDLDQELNNAQDQTKAQEQVDKAKDAVATDSPYAGKSRDELEKMIADSQSFIKQQAAEVGETRRLADSLIKERIAQPASTKDAGATADEDDELSYLVNPKEAIAREIANHPDVAAARETNLTVAQSKAQAAVQSVHKDSAEIVGTPEFLAYAKASTYRMKMLHDAINNYDADAGIELLNGFKATNGAAKADATAEATAIKEAADKALKDSSTPATGGGASGTVKRKVFTRESIRRLMKSDYKKYTKLQPEIMKAHLEGRVIGD